MLGHIEDEGTTGLGVASEVRASILLSPSVSSADRTSSVHPVRAKRLARGATTIENGGENLPQDMVGLVGPLERLVPPARVFDKSTYSPWIDGRLFRHLRAENVDTVVVTGGETDVCVLATVPGAIDLGFHVIVLIDAVCAAARTRHTMPPPISLGQLNLMPTEEFLLAAR